VYAHTHVWSAGEMGTSEGNGNRRGPRPGQANLMIKVFRGRLPPARAGQRPRGSGPPARHGQPPARRSLTATADAAGRQQPRRTDRPRGGAVLHQNSEHSPRCSLGMGVTGPRLACLTVECGHKASAATGPRPSCDWARPPLGRSGRDRPTAGAGEGSYVQLLSRSGDLGAGGLCGDRLS
jgi:hypothetical protein